MTINILSMTGYGRAESDAPAGRISVEFRSVNTRYLELSIYLPREFSAVEHPLRGKIKEAIGRGKVDCRVKFHPAPQFASQAKINESLMQSYADELKAAGEKMGLSDGVTLDALLKLPGVVESNDDGNDSEKFWEMLTPVLDEALANYNAERGREGEKLGEHLLEEIAQMRSMTEQVASGKDEVLQRYREKLTQRIAELEEQIKAKLEPGRLEMEVALFADRSDVSEELVRLASHMDRFEQLIANKKGKPAGKAMDFLIQEITREVSTLGAKTRDLELQRISLEMKSCVERMREQVQNIE